MKGILFILLSVYACNLYTAENALSLPLCITVMTSSYTERSFSIEQITRNHHHDIVDITWYEKNNRCDAPFFRHVKQQLQLSKDQTSIIINLNAAHEKALLIDFLYSLTAIPSVLICTEVIADEACTTW